MKHRLFIKLREIEWSSFIWMRLPAAARAPLKRVFGRLEHRRLLPVRAALQNILDQHPAARQVILFTPSLSWRRQLFQRPQQLALALARQGALVFYLEPKPSKQEAPFQSMEKRLYWCNLPARVFEPLKAPLVYSLTWNSGYLSAFDSPRVIYDYVDQIEAFEGNPAKLLIEHNRLVREAALLLATSGDLYQEVNAVRPDSLLCPNGVDYGHFASHFASNGASNFIPDDGLSSHPGEASMPADLSQILSRGKPVIGYHGALARWFDFDLLKTVARRRADLAFVLIGPDHDRSLLPSGILDLPNLSWLGPKSYAELPGYLHCFDVGIIPFQLNPITHATSPLKLFEYMASGKPVVITPMRESMRYEGVLVARDSEEFSKKLDQALTLRTDPEYLKLIDQVAKENTWDARASQILDALDRDKPY